MIDETTQEMIIQLANGSPGALGVLCELINLPSGLRCLEVLNKFNYTGSLIWLIYKDWLGHDITTLYEYCMDGSLNIALREHRRRDEEFNREWKWEIDNM